MLFYQSKKGLLPGTSYKEITALARREYHAIQKLTPRRQAFVRAQYFRKDKVFIGLFWEHLSQKNFIDRIRRLKYYVCAIDTIRQTTIKPDVVMEKGEILYRFYGKAKSGQPFCVQIKLNSKTGRKDFMSVFPLK